MKHPQKVYDFWEKVKKEKGIQDDFNDAWGFGDNPELKQEMIELILNGKKRTSTNLLIESKLAGYPDSRIGAYHIILDGEDNPTAVIRTVQLTLGKLEDVSDDHAYWEGEGDRTRETYLNEHIKYYKRIGEQLGFEFNLDLELEFERFKLIYP